MSEIKMSYVESVPPMRGCKHDWLTMLSELINSGHYAIKLECEDSKKAGRVNRAITQTCKNAGYDLIVIQRKSDVYIVNKAIPAKNKRRTDRHRFSSRTASDLRKENNDILIIPRRQKMRNKMKHYRLLLGLQQEELAELVGVHPSTVCMWELGRNDPSPAWQQDIAYALGVTKIEKVFPDWIPERPVQSVQGMYKERGISTMGWLRRVANIKMGEKMLVKLSNVTGDGSTYCSGTVVEIQPSWFRVKLDKSGFSTCVHYQAFVKENGVRRPKNG